jgi:uncharacterized protein YndB with AHSA1/START domain
MSKPIHQEVVFKANPARVYAVLTDAKQFSAFRGGAPAEIDGKLGGAFSCFGGMITGQNIELTADKRIVQAWRAGNWPEGIYSIVRMDLAKEGTATKLIFDHTGFPEGNREHLEGGWHKMLRCIGSP